MSGLPGRLVLDGHVSGGSDHLNFGERSLLRRLAAVAVVLVVAAVWGNINRIVNRSPEGSSAQLTGPAEQEVGNRCNSEIQSGIKQNVQR